MKRKKKKIQKVYNSLGKLMGKVKAEEAIETFEEYANLQVSEDKHAKYFCKDNHKEILL